MQESRTPEFNTNSSKSSKNRKPFNLSRKQIILSIAVVALLGVLAVTYNLGYSKGMATQKANDEKKQKKTTTTMFNPMQPDIINNRWSIVGSVEDVTSKSITVKNNKGLVQTATINEDTDITQKAAEKASVKDIKKGASVIVIGTKDDNNKFTASMVRIK